MNRPGWLSDRAAVIAAMGAAVGALHPTRWSLAVVVLVAVVVAISRWAALVPIVVALLAKDPPYDPQHRRR